jgi:hypothetical protein
MVCLGFKLPRFGNVYRLLVCLAGVEDTKVQCCYHIYQGKNAIIV